MSINEISERLINSKRPIDFFGDITDEQIKKEYRKYARICHPDLASAENKKIAESTTALLNDFYEKALEELKEGTYNLSELDIIKKSSPLFEVKSKDSVYTFYREYALGDVAVTYYGLDGDSNEVILKYPIEESDNDLIKSEYELLKELDHISLPKVVKRVKINGHESIVMSKVNGETVESIIGSYGPIPEEHVAWMLERMLSVIGYLHYNKIVHGNIKPDNLIVDIDTHNVTLLDYSLCIKEADASGARYRIINDDYSAPYIDSSSRVIPHSDIYSVGKIAIALLGGNIKSNGMPVSVDARFRGFIRKLVNQKNNDAWALWDELIKLRNDVYGLQRFQKLELKKKVG